jgi:hypothetical protein
MRRRRSLIDARRRRKSGHRADVGARAGVFAVDVEPSPVPTLAALLLGISSSAVAALIWEFGVIRCGSGSLIAVSGTCSRHHLILLPLFALLAGPVGAMVAGWRQKWWPLVAGSAIALVPALLTALMLWR